MGDGQQDKGKANVTSIQSAQSHSTKDPLSEEARQELERAKQSGNLYQAHLRAGIVPPSERIFKGIKPPAWIIEPWIEEGRLTIMKAAPGVGKSTIAHSIALAVGHRIPWLESFEVHEKPQDKRPETSNCVLTIDNEQHPEYAGNQLARMMLGRFSKEECELKQFEIVPVSAMHGVHLGSPEGQERYEWLCSFYSPRLVIVDSAAATFGGDENSAEDASLSMRFLVQASERHGHAVLLIAHTAKHDWATTNGSSKARGSGVFEAMAHQTWTVFKDDSGDVQIHFDKTRIHSDFKGIVLHYEELGTPHTGPVKLTVKKRIGHDEKARDKMERALLAIARIAVNAPPDEPIRTAVFVEAIEAEAIGTRTAKKALKSAEARGLVKLVQRGQWIAQPFVHSFLTNAQSGVPKEEGA